MVSRDLWLSCFAPDLKPTHRRMNTRRVLRCLTTAAFAGLLSLSSWAQISITSLPYNPAVTDFNAFNPTNSGNLTATIPTGWTAASSGTAAYNGQGTGSSATGGYWGYGSAGNFSLGALRSGGPGNITYAVSFTNNSGATINSITLAWDYRQYRFANTSGWDCSATGVLAGNATINSKDFTGAATGTSGATTAVSSFTISGLTITNGQTFGFSWVTTDATSSDNGV
ncbi:MAG TPA: hypothetical protein VHL57_02115, partial [Flavobacteriales bacterium]|nr:hypothetical protein [Flavobacteriales bacterium]